MPHMIEMENDVLHETALLAEAALAGDHRAKDRTPMIRHKLWIAPPTKMDMRQLTEEGYYAIFGKAGARTEMPGCSLCMGNQARVADGATVVSTSTRNFPNRLGKGANVYLSSAELAAVAAMVGKIPTVAEYMEAVKGLQPMASDIYRYLNFDQIPEYEEVAKKVIPIKAA